MTKQTATASTPTLDDDVVEAEIVPDVQPLGGPPPAGAIVPVPVQPAGGLSLVGDDPWSQEDSGDLAPYLDTGSIPFVDLNRKVDGGFVEPETHERVRELDFVWLLRKQTRAWWPDEFGKGGKDGKVPQCRSSDGLAPDPESPQLQNPDCVTCKHAKWADNEPPACKASIEALALVLGGDDGESESGFEYGNVMRLRFGGMAFAPARDYYTKFSSKRHLPNRPAWSVVTHVELEEKPTDNGVFLVPKFTKGMSLPYDPANVAHLKAIQSESKAAWSEAVAADLASGAGHAPQDGDGPGPFDGPTAADRAEAERPFDDTDRTLKVDEGGGGGIFDDPRDTDF